MEIKKMSKKTEKKLINYILTNSNIVELKLYDCCIPKEKDNRVINIIKKNKPKNFKFTLSKKALNNLYEEFKNNPEIFDKKYRDKYENNNLGFDDAYFEKIKEDNRKSRIIESIKRYLYYKSIQNFFKKYQSSLIYKKEKVQDLGDRNNSYYYFKLDKAMKNCIKSKKSIYDWNYPYSLEDITFYKNGKGWFWSISHEDIYEICFQDKKEYEYLKSIGVTFFQKNFTAFPDEYIPLLNIE